MNDWLRWLIGVDASPDWMAGGEWHLEFDALPTGTAVAVCLAGALAAVIGIVWLYRREARDLGRFPRLIMAGSRLLVLACLAAMLLEAVVVLTKREQVPSYLPVLVDTSQSMGLEDPWTDSAAAVAAATSFHLTGPDDRPDLEQLRTAPRLALAVRQLDRVIPQLAEGRIVPRFAFDTGLAALPEGTRLADLQAAGTGTALGSAIEGVLDAHRGQPLAGLVLVTEGQSNAGADPLEAARRAATEGVPLYIAAAGTEEGPRNMRLLDIDHSPVVFLDDPAELSVLVSSQGLNSKTTTLTVEQRGEGGDWEELGRQDVTLGEDAVVQRITFPLTPQTAGQFDLRARLEEIGPELSLADNAGTSTLKVVRQTIRVLLVAGYPFHEVQFLRNALLRDKTLEFSSWLQNAAPGYEQVGSHPIRRLPITQEELNHYDVLILFDPDQRLFPANFPELLLEFVGQAAGGLIYVAGEHHTHQVFHPGLYDDGGPSTAGIDNSWLKMLPVIRDPGLFTTTAEVALSSRETYTLELTPQGLEDPAFHFADDPQQNREILSSLPGMYWHFPVTRAKPGATVLAQHGDPRMRNAFGRHVVLATHLYGPGRTVFVGFDSTHRWRYLNEAYFDGFWARMIDRVGRNKVLGGRYPFTLATDKSNYRVQDRIQITARFNHESDIPQGITGLVGELEVAGGESKPLTLDPSPDEPGLFETSLTAEQAGPYLLRIRPAGTSEFEQGPRAATLAFRVEPPRLEIDRPTQNRALLGQLAQATGGAVVAIEDIDTLESQIKVRQVQRVLEYREEVWDAPLLFGTAFLLLVFEWLLRKRLRLA